MSAGSEPPLGRSEAPVLPRRDLLVTVLRRGYSNRALCRSVLQPQRRESKGSLMTPRLSAALCALVLLPGFCLTARAEDAIAPTVLKKVKAATVR
jgi:hypothetical protein